MASAIMVTLFSMATITVVIKTLSWKPQIYVSNQRFNIESVPVLTCLTNPPSVNLSLRLLFPFQQPSHHSYYNSADEFYVEAGRRTPSYIDMPAVAKRPNGNDYSEHSNGKRATPYRNYPF